MLADQGVAKLVAQSANVRSQLVVARDHTLRLGEISRVRVPVSDGNNDARS